jgi:uncharacterized protein (DUF983 family)
MSAAASDESKVRGKRPSTAVLLWRGARRKCPVCGGGKLFHRWFNMAIECPTCAYHFEREEGFFLGAFVMNTIITLAALMLFLFVSFALTLPDPPLVKLAIIGGTVGVLLPVVAYPFTKTLWCAVDLIMRRTLGNPWAGSRQQGSKN